MKAIVFAAGLGTRLKPFTLEHPKALVEVGGMPMLGHVISRLVGAGIDEIIVNVHHFSDQIVDFLDKNRFGVKILVSDESDMLLDTGGGIAKAADILDGNEPFVACNADILTDFDLRAMIAAHLSSDADVTLMVANRTSSRMLYFDASERLRGWQNLSTGATRPEGLRPNDFTPRAFGGYHIINPSVLPLLKEKASTEPVFSITPFYLDNLARLCIKGFTPEGEFRWFDVGRPETLALARESFKQ